MNVHGHEHDRPQRRDSATFWDRKMMCWRRFDDTALGAHWELGARC
jgi:hypothetical protein